MANNIICDHFSFVKPEELGGEYEKFDTFWIVNRGIQVLKEVFELAKGVCKAFFLDIYLFI